MGIAQQKKVTYQEGFNDGKAGYALRYTRKYYFYDQYKAGYTVGKEIRDSREVVKGHVAFYRGVIQFFKGLFKK